MLHTWTRERVDLSHVYAIVSAGEWSEPTRRGVPSRGRFHFSVKAMARVFRATMREPLRDAMRSADVVLDVDSSRRTACEGARQRPALLRAQRIGATAPPETERAGQNRKPSVVRFPPRTAASGRDAALFNHVSAESECDCIEQPWRVYSFDRNAYSYDSPDVPVGA